MNRTTPTPPSWIIAPYACICLLFLPVALSSGAGVLTVTQDNGVSNLWSADRLKESLKSELKPIKYTLHGEEHTANAVPLIAVLKASDVPVALKMDPKADPKVKNLNLRLVVTIKGGDGYTTSFSLAELMPEIGEKEVWLALDEDGKPLPPRDGIAKLIVPGDKMPARWVHDVVTIAVVNPAPATRPAGG